MWKSKKTLTVFTLTLLNLWLMSSLAHAQQQYP